MKKDKKETANKKQLSVQSDTVLRLANQEQVPFLYVAMKEPSPEYRQAADSKKKLYRLIKIK